MIVPVKRAFVLIALLLGSCTATPPPLDPGLRNKIDQRARLVKSPKQSGFVIGLIQDGVSRVIGHGRLSESESKAPGGDTVFEIGSITKTFTATLLWQEALAGTISLDDPIDRYLPKGVRPPRRNGKSITLQHLSTHRSGLPRLPGNLAPKDSSNPYADFSIDDLYDAVDSVELSEDPGERYEYSNLGVGLLGQLLVLKNGKSYESLVVERICVPLGMMDTRITLDDDQKRRLAPGHDADGHPVANWDLPALAGAGALRSTVNDMLRYLEAQFSDAYAGTQSARATVGGAMSIGLGWHLIPSKGSMIVWHNGGTGGYRSWAGFVKATRTAVVVLANSTAEVDTLGMSLLKLLQDVQ